MFYYLVQDLKVRVSIPPTLLTRVDDTLWGHIVLDLFPHLPPLQDQAYINVVVLALGTALVCNRLQCFQCVLYSCRMDVSFL